MAKQAKAKKAVEKKVGDSKRAGFTSLNIRYPVIFINDSRQKNIKHFKETLISQDTGKTVWYSHLLKNFPQFVVIHTGKGFGTVNKAEVDVFLELSCFFDGPTHVGILISDSSALSKTSLNIWKFTVHVLLKPGLENFEHYFASM